MVSSYSKTTTSIPSAVSRSRTKVIRPSSLSMGLIDICRPTCSFGLVVPKSKVASKVLFLSVARGVAVDSPTGTDRGADRTDIGKLFSATPFEILKACVPNTSKAASILVTAATAWSIMPALVQPCCPSTLPAVKSSKFAVTPTTMLTVRVAESLSPFASVAVTVTVLSPKAAVPPVVLTVTARKNA